jgi:hypothetical protein
VILDEAQSIKAPLSVTNEAIAAIDHYDSRYLRPKKQLKRMEFWVYKIGIFLQQTSKVESQYGRCGVSSLKRGIDTA